MGKTCEAKLGLADVGDSIEKQLICSILITCIDSLNNGSMEVDMQVEGDEELALFLLESARQVLDQQVDGRGIS